MNNTGMLRQSIRGVALLAAAAVLGYFVWYRPRESRLELEQQGHRFFALGELDSAVSRYETAMRYGKLSEVADDMYRMAHAFRTDTVLKAEYFELADSLGPKLIDSAGRPR